ncbi:MAG: nucleotidyltransferase domain-containing protein [candidate division WOR-3 bacterium]
MKKVLKEINNIIKRLKEHPKVVAVYIFGSYAKGYKNINSDIDIAVIMKDISFEDEAEIGSMYSKKIDLVLFHKLPLYIQFEVLKYGKEIFVKDEEYLKEIKFKVLREYHEMQRYYQMMKESILNENT